MKQYDLIVIGTGSAMNIVDAMIQQNPKIRVAVIDKDEPGGICLTRGCIPSKILLYPAELVRTIERSAELNVHAEIKKVDFEKVMDRMRSLIGREIDQIRQGLSSSENIDYYRDVAEFVSPYTMKVGREIITAKMIFLCTGSRAIIPPIKGLDNIEYLTSDTLLKLKQLPESVAIVGGGYIAAEYGHFLSSMGSNVTIIGRNPQFLPDEEPEISELAMEELGKHMRIFTNLEVKEVKQESGKSGNKIKEDKRGKIVIVAEDKKTGQSKRFEAEKLLIATGRGPTNDILHPEKGGVRLDKDGWILVDEYLQTSQPNVWALGDADGKFLFKHVANYESQVLYYNAVLGKKVKADYHAIPHAVFTYPEIAAVGMKEKQAVEEFGKEGVLIGYYKYEDTAKGEAMALSRYFVKAILKHDSLKILGAHVIGPYASIIIQEIINVMYTPEQSGWVVNDAIHIHPSLSEVVQRAFQSPMTVDQYHEMLDHERKHRISKAI